MQAHIPRYRSINKPCKKLIGQFTSEAEFLAEENRQFQAVVGKVDWEQAKKDGLIS